MTTSDITRTGLCAALVAVLTRVVQFPTPATQGYINVGDAAIFVTAILFGPIVGGLAGGVGSSLADILGGYLHWAPFTLVIKGTEGWLAGWMFRSLRGSRWVAPTLVVAGGWMVGGYLVVEIILYGWATGVANVGGNAVQAGVSVLIALPLCISRGRLRQQ